MKQTIASLSAKRNKREKMRILAISDFHGKIPKINRRKLKFDVIISPGDFCSSEKIRKIQFDNWDSNIRWYDIIGKIKAKKLAQADIASGARVLKRLDKMGPALVVPGNSEYTGGDSGWKFIDKDYYCAAHEKLKKVIDVEYGLFDVGEFQVIGYGKSSAPEKYVSKAMYKQVYRALKKLFKKAKKEDKPVVLVSHNVPYGVMDKVKDPESPMYGEHLGSNVVKRLVKRYKPALCICGHMHENQGVEKVGRTVVVNCGFGFVGQYAIIDIDDDKVDVRLVTGSTKKAGKKTAKRKVVKRKVVKRKVGKKKAVKRKKTVKKKVRKKAKKKAVKKKPAKKKKATKKKRKR